MTGETKTLMEEEEREAKEEIEDRGGGKRGEREKKETEGTGMLQRWF